MLHDLTAEQQAKLEDDATNRQPIGSDEILLVGDIRFGIPVLKRYYDGRNDLKQVRSSLENISVGICGQFMAWTRTGVDESVKTLMEVQRLRELVKEADSAAVDE